MAMSGKVAFALAALCLIYPHSTLAQSNDTAPIVKVVEIGNEYVVFDVSGANTFHNLPVKSINVNYSQIASMNRGQPEVNVKTHVLHSKLGFERLVNITKLDAGASYQFQFFVTNTMGERGQSSQIDVLLKPQTPDFSISHKGENTIRLFWGYPDEKQIDYFLLTVEKESNPGCGFTLNFTRCFGKKYDLANFESGQTYIFKFVSHNPSGDSETVEVLFPYD